MEWKTEKAEKNFPHDLAHFQNQIKGILEILKEFTAQSENSFEVPGVPKVPEGNENIR